MCERKTAYVFLREGVCGCLCLRKYCDCMYEDAQMCVCVCARWQCRKPAFLDHSPLYSLRRGFSMSPELTNWLISSVELKVVSLAHPNFK